MRAWGARNPNSTVFFGSLPLNFRCFHLILILCFAAAPGLAAQTATIASVSIGTSLDAGRVNLLEYRQHWRYSGAAYYVGSFLQYDANGPRDILYQNRTAATMTIEGGTMQGVDSTLLAPGRSDTFVIAGEGVCRILFYRSFYLFAPCDAYPDAPPYNRDPNIVTTPWDVDDNCEWRVQLRRSSDDAHLFTLDSVGVPIHDDPVLNPLYGEHVKRKRLCVVLPQEFNGEEVYLQVVVLRRGPTLRPIVLRRFPIWGGERAAAESFEPSACADFDPRSPEVFNSVLHYLDSVKIATGWQPRLRNYPITPQQEALVKQRYSLESRHGRGDFRTEINVRPQRIEFWRDNPDGSRNTSVSLNDAIQYIAAEPEIVRDVCRLTFTLRETMNVRCWLSTIAGQELQELWNGELNGSKHTLSLNIDRSALTSDTYLLFVSDADGTPAASIPVTISVD